VKKRLSMKVVSDALGQTFPPLKPEGQPTETFTKGGKMTFGKEKLEYAYVPNIHTDNDSWVFFPEANILHTGDMFFNGLYPYIDYSTGGLLSGMASSYEHLAKVGDAKTRVIPGHGPRGVPDPNANVYAADDGVYRFVPEGWQKNTGGDNWTPAAPSALLIHDRRARLDGYRGYSSEM